MKKDLGKKLATYTSVSTAIMLLHGSADAQIIYNDPPDIVINNGDFDIDLNNDGTFDFRFTDNDYPNAEFVYVAGHDYSDQVLGGNDCLGGYWIFPKMLHIGQPIKNNTPGKWKFVSYSSSSFVMFCSAGGTGGICEDVNGWDGTIKGFFGFRFKNQPGQNNYNYGWMRVSVSSNCQGMKIHDWAYNSVAGNSITAGQTMRLNGSNDPAEESSLENLSIFSYHDQLYIKNNAGGALLHICLLDLNGRKLTTMNFSDVETKIDLTPWPDGMYIVQLSTETASVSKKIVKD